MSTDMSIKTSIELNVRAHTQHVFGCVVHLSTLANITLELS